MTIRLLAQMGLRPLLAFLLMCCLLPATAQNAMVVGGVRYDLTADMRGHRVALNGAGVRYRAVVKVYTVGLYLPTRAATAEEALAMTGARRVSVTMLRDIDSNELGKLFMRAIEDNVDKAAAHKLLPSMVRMGQMFSDVRELKKGDGFSIDWLPGTGAIISVKGQPMGEVYRDPEFFNAMLRIWLGPRPVDRLLKDALLGKPQD